MSYPEITNDPELQQQRLDYVVEVLDRWTEDEDLKRAFLGLDGGVSLSNFLNNPGLTAALEERCNWIFMIKADLDNVFQGSIDHEKTWLKTKSKGFDGKSPIDVIKEGNLAQVFGALMAH